MTRTAVRWGLAVVITLVAAAWQRVSGPTYPARGVVTVGGTTVAVTLERSHSTSSDQPVTIRVSEPTVSGEVAWRRFPTAEVWRVVALQRQGELLSAALPRQPSAGKLEYQVRLRHGGEEALFPPRPAITRFKGDVPAAVLVPHILAMFVGMLLSTAAGLAAVTLEGDRRRLAWLALLLILVGGFLLGPAVQKYAFGEWWAGVPYGWDLTDNKTLLAGAAWVLAVWRLRGGRPARVAVIAAAAVTLAVFAIPHSAWGSQIDWSKVPTPSEARSLSE